MPNGSAYSMTVIGGYQRPLQRQIQKSAMISMFNADIKMNSMSESNSARFPRIHVEVGE